MIQANELRLGNWVLAGSGYNQIQSIGTVFCQTVALHSYEFVHPISITPEIFNACDFMYDDFPSEKWFSSDIGYIAKCEGGYTLPDSDGEPSIGYVLQYVHQLQNLFHSLTGKELIIEL